MIQMNSDIVYVRSYNGSLVPLSKVMLVTTDPNSGKVLQEVPLANLIEKLMHHNMNSFEKTECDLRDVENYDIVTKAKP